MTTVSNDQRREQRRTLCQFLRRLLSDDDYGAVASPGWRPKDWRSPEERAEQPPPPARPASDRLEPGGAIFRETPRYEDEIDRHAGWWAQQPLYLRQLVKPALLGLPLRERLAVEFHCLNGLGFEAIERWRPRFQGLGLACSDTTIYRLHEKALGLIAAQVWHPDGQPRWEALKDDS